MDSSAPGHAGKKSLAYFGNRSPHGNRGSQYSCDLQCGRPAIRINGTRLQVRIPLCGWWGCRYLCGSHSRTTRTDVNQGLEPVHTIETQSRCVLDVFMYARV
ncbi:unnamed protein product [Staurois parvus]|uniref:Uncharacterized protein n=1 Tax=Staurois parvus TaxID=386267 RepID=A0ABN9BL91_9NEOB|nr:unnamed protein product [Staurois parvus]